MVKLEAGKYYCTRGGRKVGPAVRRDRSHAYPWDIPQNKSHYYTDGGQAGSRSDPEWDIVSEWQDEGPVRTVTRNEIVPGVYGRLRLNEEWGSVRIQIYPAEPLTADELDAAARTLQQLAEALREETN